ncbi:TetR/AcrR family transcriptional regulator [Streptomyces sp. NBC_01089]|uniref:TetR/AcrR family transcriptional regulator n=1 Tax=Streptomyces sp. NBC_01089 TaxID=2903747 RepID=UPI003869B14B|nr:TetR/AcrR family transcriptional regulator [Streptomyces sp. NBC_01089]
MPRPPQISREAALAEAVRILDEEGVGALSMRRIAQRLDVSSPSLYKYFRNLEDVLDAVTDEVVREIGSGATYGADWRAELAELARRYFRTFQRHPNAILLVMRRPVRSEASLTGLDAVLRGLTDSGWETERAIRAVLLVESYSLGAAMTAVSSGVTDDPALLAGRPALAAALTGGHPAFRLDAPDFEHGLTFMLDGLDREIAPPDGMPGAGAARGPGHTAGQPG